MIARALVYMRALLPRRRKVSGDFCNPWVLLASYRRRPPATPRWASTSATGMLREMTVDELREDPRRPRLERRRWLDKRS